MIQFLGVYLHDIDPYAIELWDGGPIRWYGLSYLFGFLIGYWLLVRITRVGKSTLRPQQVGDFVISMAIGIVIGGRVGYVVFYRPDLLWSFNSAFPYWGVLAVNEGGMASHGWIIGGLFATLYYARRYQHSWCHLLDLMSFGGPLGLLLGRIANFINGELLGRACSPDLPWAVKFPQEMYRWDDVQLRQLEPVAKLVSTSVQRDLYGLYALIPKIIEEIQNGNQIVAQALAPMLTPRHPSQLYAGALEGGLVFLVLAIAWTRPRKPLVIGSLACLTYAVVRIFDEMFREPDAHIGYQWLNLTRGQWLSMLMLVVGVVFLVIFAKRDVPKMGGWVHGANDESTGEASGK